MMHGSENVKFANAQQAKQIYQKRVRLVGSSYILLLRCMVQKT